MKEKILLMYNALSEADKKAVLDYFFNNEITKLNEGVFSGPLGKLEKGLFSGPVSGQTGCPTCRRPM